jgi:hypothetical protein
VSRGPLTFKQRDVSAAIKAVVQAGQQVQRVEISREGRIVIIFANGKEQAPEQSDTNEWDAVLK